MDFAIVRASERMALAWVLSLSLLAASAMLLRTFALLFSSCKDFAIVRASERIALAWLLSLSLP